MLKEPVNQLRIHIHLTVSLNLLVNRSLLQLRYSDSTYIHIFPNQSDPWTAVCSLTCSPSFSLWTSTFPAHRPPKLRKSFPESSLFLKRGSRKICVGRSQSRNSLAYFYVFPAAPLAFSAKIVSVSDVICVGQQASSGRSKFVEWLRRGIMKGGGMWGQVVLWRGDVAAERLGLSELLRKVAFQNTIEFQRLPLVFGNFLKR